MSEEQQASFNGWAKVEVMGHQSHIGYVRTEVYGAAVLFRIDTPDLPEREFVLEKPDWVDGKYTGAGALVAREARQGCTVLVGSGSIYRIIPCTEDAARRAIDQEQRANLRLISPPPMAALAAAQADSDDEEEDPYEDDPSEVSFGAR